jgi:hypothetical protein
MMFKITDNQYFLPHIQALSGFDVLRNGSTEPMLIGGADRTSGKRNRYVVKFTKAPRMSFTAAGCELLGAWMGKELGLNVAEPAVVHVGEAFADSLSGRNGYQDARNSAGINFGSVYLEGFFELIKGKSALTHPLSEEARNIFAFDMFVSNSDRGAGKPNVLTNGENFVIYDHELAFSFIRLLPSLRSKTPWLLGEAEREMYEKHFFYSYLKNSRIDFYEFTERFSQINDYFWSRVVQFMPPEWYTEEIVFIKDYLQAIIENRKMFSQQLTKILLT